MARAFRFTKAARKARKKAYNNTKRLCELCDREIRRGGWSEHVTTSRHKKALRKDRREKKKLLQKK